TVRTLGCWPRTHAMTPLPSCAGTTVHPKRSRVPTYGVAHYQPTCPRANTGSRSGRSTAGRANSGRRRPTGCSTRRRSGPRTGPTGSGLRVDPVERFHPQMTARGLACACLGVVLAAIHQHGVHAGFARRIELLDDVGQEQHLAGGQFDGLGDAAVAVGFALAADLGVEPARE